MSPPLFLAAPPCTVLPNLHKVTSDTSTLAQIASGRPVMTVILTAPWPMTSANGQLSELDEDDRATIACVAKVASGRLLRRR